MHRSNSNWTRSRGSVSLLVLVMVTVLLNLAFAQFTAVSLALKTGQAHGLHPDKDDQMDNLLQLVRLQGGEESGSGGEGPTAYSYQSLSFAHNALETTAVSVRFTRQPAWPHRQGLWVGRDDWHIFVHDYRED